MKHVAIYDPSFGHICIANQYWNIQGTSYLVCDSATNSSEKIITLNDITSFLIKEDDKVKIRRGVVFRIKFTNAQTYKAFDDTMYSASTSNICGASPVYLTLKFVITNPSNTYTIRAPLYIGDEAIGQGCWAANEIVEIYYSEYHRNFQILNSDIVFRGNAGTSGSMSKPLYGPYYKLRNGYVLNQLDYRNTVNDK